MPSGGPPLLRRTLYLALALCVAGCNGTDLSGDDAGPARPITPHEAPAPVDLQSVVQGAYDNMVRHYPEGSIQIQAVTRTELLDPRQSWDAVVKSMRPPPEEVVFRPEKDFTTGKTSVVRGPGRPFVFEYDGNPTLAAFGLVGIELTMGAEHFSYDAMLVRYETAEKGCTFALFDPMLPMPELPSSLGQLFPGCRGLGKAFAGDAVTEAEQAPEEDQRAAALAGGNCPSLPPVVATPPTPQDVLCGSPSCAWVWPHSGTASGSVTCVESSRSKETSPGSGLYRRKKDCAANPSTQGMIQFSGPYKTPNVDCDLPRECSKYSSYAQDVPTNFQAVTLTEDDPTWGPWPRGGHVAVDFRASAYGAIRTYSRSTWSLKGTCGGKYDKPNHSADVSVGIDWTWERTEKFDQAEIANVYVGSTSIYTCMPANSEECTDACKAGQNQCSGNIVQNCQQNTLCYNWVNGTDCAASGKICQNGACVDGPDGGTDGGTRPDGGTSPDGGSDGGTGGGSDGGSDGGTRPDGGSGSDGGSDGGTRPDGGLDGGLDAGFDGGLDGGSDGGTDGGSDGGPQRADGGIIAHPTDAAIAMPL